MLIRFFRAGEACTVGESPPGETAFRTRVDITGTVQRQLLLDYEEDRICVVRCIHKDGSIGGRRLFPCADNERADDCA